MGCAGSLHKNGDDAVIPVNIRKPKPWKHPEKLTKDDLLRMRAEFWDTAPHYGGHKEIWDALKGAIKAIEEKNITHAEAIVKTAGIIVNVSDMTICYDEQGSKYELPNYVLSEPTNMKHT